MRALLIGALLVAGCTMRDDARPALPGPAEAAPPAGHVVRARIEPAPPAPARPDPACAIGACLSP